MAIAFHFLAFCLIGLGAGWLAARDWRKVDYKEGKLAGLQEAMADVAHELLAADKLEEEISGLTTAERAVAGDLIQISVRLAAGIREARQMSLDLCHQIEKCEAAPEQTNASIMASDLHAKLNELLPD